MTETLSAGTNDVISVVVQEHEVPLKVWPQTEELQMAALVSTTWETTAPQSPANQHLCFYLKGL